MKGNLLGLDVKGMRKGTFDRKEGGFGRVTFDDRKDLAGDCTKRDPFRRVRAVWVGVDKWFDGSKKSSCYVNTRVKRSRRITPGAAGFDAFSLPRDSRKGDKEPSRWHQRYP